MTTTRTTRKVSSTSSKPKMKIESLAVKYRPKVLEDLVGQPHLVSQLRGMFKAGKIPSAILLAGESGTGKTTTARMIARYLNCNNPDPATHAPCGECISCKYGDGHPDFLEMNMADARGIDDIRGLIASSKNMPVMGENRIFLLDECFPPDTEIEVEPGKFRTISDICSDTQDVNVLSFNHETGEVESKQVEAKLPKPSDDREMVEVILADGSVQPCTSNHKWWSVTRGMMVEAKDLMPEEELLVIYES